MPKRTRVILIVIVVAIAGYLAYRWYKNRNSTGLAGNTAGTGSNLNSLAPELVAGSSGPSSGLTYEPGSTTVDLTLPDGTTPAQTTTQTGGGGVGNDGDGTDKDDRPPVRIPRCPGGFHWDEKKRACVPGKGERPRPVKPRVPVHHVRGGKPGSFQ